MEDQKFLQGIKSTLYGSGCSLTATVITVSYLRFPDGTEVVTGDLGELNYATIGTGENQEIISFTEDITKNANGTTTLNVCVRGLQFGTPYTADSSLRRAHGGGTRFVMSNNPQLYADLLSTDNDETITGKYTFPGGGTANAPVSGTVYSEPTDDLEYVSKKYADDLAIAGSPKATEAVYGITKLSVAAVSPTDPIAVGDNDTRVSPVSLATVTAGQVQAMAGTSGTPSTANKYVTNDDTTSTPTADAVVRAGADALIAGKWVNAVTKTLIAGETINGATTPVAVYLGTDNEVYAADGNNIGKVNVIGFAVSNGTNGNSIDVQTAGYVTGFTGLTTGVSYFVSDSQTLSVAPGTFRVMVGRAVSTTTILIDIENQRLWQRGLIGDGGLVTSFGKDWGASISGGGGTAINERKTAQISANSASADDRGQITGSGIAAGDSSTESNISFALGSELQARTYMSAITGNSLVGMFIGFSPKVFADPDTQVNTTNHAGFFWMHTVGGGSTWTLYTSNANGTTQTINTIGGYADPFTERTYLIQYDLQEIRFYIDGVLVRTHNTNMPTGQTGVNTHGVYAWSDAAGGTARWDNVYVTKQLSYWVASFN